uniref:Peptidase A2 domain-containing protein n=1 Tax=Haemonchus contortus TaxID=6289 RepID=W6NLJ3_HAECO
MASALIFNEASGDYQPVTILLDSGAQKSFIKADMRNRLRLPTISSTSFTTTGMGELQETFKSNEVKVTLKGLHSSRELQGLSVFTKEKLTTTTKTALLSGADKSFIKREKIIVAQQTLRPLEVLPDLLIGQDLLNQVIEHQNPVLKLPSGLVLTSTIFGYTISGTGSIPNSMKQVRDVQCGSLIVATPPLSSNDYSKTVKNISGAEAPLANIRGPIPFRRSAEKARLKRISNIPPERTPRKKKGPMGQPKTTLRIPLVSQDCKGVFSNKDASDTSYALLDRVNDIKWKLNRMEDHLRRLDERMHTLDLRTQQVTQMEVFRPGAPQCPTVPATRSCYMIGHQAKDGQIRSAILQASTGRIAQKPTNRIILKRKPSSSSRKKADAPVRRQTPRAARNQAPLNTSVSS